MLDKARHNYKLCKLIHEMGGFNDWVITIAFYAALHYATHFIFSQPGFQLPDPRNTSRPRKFTSFNEYATACRFAGIEKSKHKLLKELIRAYASEIARDYEGLFDDCHYARYRSRETEKEFVVLNLSRLERIRSFCDEGETGPGLF